MSNNYNILRNQKQPSGEDIARHKDFDALLATYKATQPEKKHRGAMVRRLTYVAVAVAAAAAAVILVVNVLSAPSTSGMSEEEYFAQQPFVNPPLEQAEPTFAMKTVDANTGGTYETNAGARLVVPTQAFMTDRGELIEGEVNLHYRELSDYVDFFLAGVPMTYDSAGNKYQFESAGMIEFYAEKNGERVVLAPGKIIQVELITEMYLPESGEAPDFNIYKLDITNRNWVYQEVEHVQIIEDIAIASEDINNNNPVNALSNEFASKIAAIETAAAERLRAIEASVPSPAEPLKPLQASSNRPAISPEFLEDATIEDDPNTPENENERLRALLEGTTWQLAPNTAYDERDFQIIWENVRLRKLNNRDYELTATKGNRTLKLIVNPVLTGTQYQRAMTQYERDHAEWEKQMEAREAQLKDQKAALQSDVKQQKTQARQEFEKKMAELGLEADDVVTKKKVINRFAVDELGLWSCDRFIAKAEQQLNGQLEDQFGDKYKNQVAYLVDKKHNTIYRYYVTDDNPVRFDKNSDNLLWVITDDNKVAVLKPTDFKKASQKQSKTVKLNLVEQPIQREEDARAVLSWQ